MSKTDFQTQNIWAPSEPLAALHQVAGLCRQVVPFEPEFSVSGSSFLLSGHGTRPRKGIQSLIGKLVDDSIILIRVEVFRGPRNVRVSSSSFFQHLSQLSEKARLVCLQDGASDESSLLVELKVQASPLSMSRSGAFISELRQLAELAEMLHADLPLIENDQELIKLYQHFQDTLTPVNPLLVADKDAGGLATLLDWAREITDFLMGASSVAVVSPFSGVLNLALSALALAGQEFGRSFGLLLRPSIDAKGLIELTGKAPGLVVVPAVGLSLATNRYEMGNEILALMASLATANRPVVFIGSRQEIQTVFHGGQGGMNDPLTPILRSVPDVPFDIVMLHEIRSAARLVGGLPQAVEEEVAKDVVNGLEDVPPAERNRILRTVVSRTVNIWAAGKKTACRSAASFASTVGELSETVAGLSPKPRASRSAEVQERYSRALADPDLLPFFQEHLLAQDEALEELVSRLYMEALTRPLHQPIRYCAQGAPATGKSESAVLLAEKLGIPHVNIDAASLPDYYTAAAQLLGSGRGIVGSHESGRLEKAAKHHAGVVVEVSDLDHASPSVRSALADLFLQVLETGEAQTSTGAMFSCANIVFAFTMNLPGGMDHAVRKGIGFNHLPSRREVGKRIASEIEMMLSGAFLSRVGTPILFEPLSGDALAVIVERAIKKAILSAADRLHSAIRDVILEAGTGQRVIASLAPGVAASGARALLEHGRSLAARALVELRQGHGMFLGKTLVVSAANDGRLKINPL